MKIFHINTLLTFICFNYLVNAQNPNFLWAKQFGASSYDIGQSIAVDDSGNVFTLGNFDGTVDFDPGPGIFNLTSSNGASFVSKLDASGNFIWVKQTGGSAFKVDGNGDVYITGGFNGTVDLDPGPGIYNLNPVGDGDMFISKLDASGNFIWARQIGGANSVVGSNAISFDTNGNIYTIGGFNGTVDFDPSPDIFNLISTNNGDAFISKLDASGNFIWAKQLGGTNSVGISSISLDAIGNVYTTGSFIFTSDFDPGPATYNLTGSNNGSAFVLKLDMSGDFVWAKLLGETPYHQFLSGGSTSNSIYVDHLSNVYTTGSFSWIADFDPGPGTFYLDGYFGINNTFISKLDASGNFVWAKLLAKGPSTSQGGSVNVDASGNVYTTGTFLGAPDFDPGPGNYNLTTNGLYDIFMSKLDSDGNFLWALQFGESNNDSGGSILDPSGNIYTTGYFSGTVDFNPSEETYNLSSAGIYDIFVLKLSSLNPCTAVSISTQPYNQSATVGGIATFNIIGDGTSPFTYQWKKNGINIPNANNASYTTPILTMTDNGNLYICVVMNCNGTNSITSNNALLTVCARPTQQASKIKFSPTCINPIKVSWSNGNGVRRVVKINTNNNFTAPLYGTDPVANPVYSGSGEQVIYNGTSNTVNLTINRSNINSFWIRVYEANCDGTFSYYNSLPSTDNPINIKTEDLLKLSFYETPACQNKQNGTATVEVFGGKGKQYSYLWSNTPPSRTKTAKNLAQGVYSVTVTSSTGCIAEGMTTVPSNPEIKVTAKVSTNNDPPFTVQINASGGIPGYTYRIGTSSGNYPNNSQNFPFFDNLTEGIYFFEVKDALGCTAEISVVVGKKGDCPYPIIFIHGFSGDETTWDAVYDKNEFKHIWGALADVLHTVNNAYDYTKVDGTNNVFENVNDDVLLGLHTFKKGCLYAVNMKNWWNEDPNNPQIEKHSSNPQNGQSESNESAILKSGYVIKNAINEVLKANSGKSKVILFCHSMGGLGAREYLQRTIKDENDIEKHRWWLYPNEEDGHRVAKVFTVSTPHRGSNVGGAGDSDLKDNGSDNGIIPNANNLIPNVKSEAARDLRYSYEIDVEGGENYNYQGIYLYGGDENVINGHLSGGLLKGFHNYDVDCNGDESSEYVVGINQAGNPIWDGNEDNIEMALPLNVRYTYYVGNHNHSSCNPIKYTFTYGCFGDKIVSDDRQWLYENGDGSTYDFMEGISKPRPTDGVEYGLSDRFTSEKIVVHTHAPPADLNLPFAVIDDIDFLVRGIDEGDFPKFAYEIKENIKYAGITQIRPEKIPVGSEYTNMGNRNIDGDWYKIILPNSNTKKKIQIQLNPNILTSGRIDFYQNTPTGYSNANAPPNYFKTFGINQSNTVYITTNYLSPGTYYFRITHHLNDILNGNIRKDAWKKPYTFTVTFLNNFNEELETRTKNDSLIFGSAYPNPFNSSFSLDIFNPVDKEIILDINLYNSLNQTVLQKTQAINMGENTLSFPSSKLPSGVYVLSIKAGEFGKTIKLIKM